MTGPQLDPRQQQVVAHATGPLRVLGGPGTGTTTALVEMVARRVRQGLDPAHVLLLAPSRAAAARLRDQVALRVGRTIREPVARTAHSYAFGLLRRQAVLDGLPPPRLLAGAEQQLVIAELLAGAPARWPDDVQPALRTRTFAASLRDLLLRAAERGLTPADLVALGRRHDRPLWVAAGQFASEYAGVTALAHPTAYDPAELVRAAVDLLGSDPALLAAEQSQRRLVVVDRYEEADPPLVDLLHVLGDGGRDVVVAGDPDTCVFTFRGAEPAALEGFCEQFPRLDGSPAPTVVLTANHRLPPVLADAARRVSARLGGVGAQRAMAPRPPAAPGEGGRLDVRVLASTSDEMVQVAAHLRRAHLRDGVAWSQMAVLVRAAGDLAAVRRGLARHGVPVAQRTDEVALAQQTPVKALLDLLAVVTGRDEATPDLVADLLAGPYGRVDPLRLRGVRRALLVADRQAGGQRSADVLLAAVVLDGEPVPSGAGAVEPLARVVAAGRRAPPSASVEQVLWAMWDASGVGEQWRRAALGGGPEAAEADRDLDAMLGLFDAAARFTDRLPGAGPGEFLDHVRAQQVPAASWSAGAPAREAVSVLTVHAAKDREFDTVAVARAQDDLWPDLRRRDSVLETTALVDLLAHGRPPSATEQVTALLAAERRLLYVAVSRARRSLLVTAVDDGDSRPSRLLDELAPVADLDAERGPGLPDRVMGLAHLVGELRAAVCDAEGDQAERAEAARLLAVLARDGVPGAHPDQWYGLAPVTDARPLVQPGEKLRVSPSQIEGYLRCPLRWLLQRAGGDSGGVLRATIGVLVHELARDAAVEQLDAAQVWQRYEQIWQQVDAGSGWVARRERARVDAMVRRLLDWMASNPRTLVAAECEVSVARGDTVVSGRVDRLDRDAAGALVVVDFKTGATAVTKKAAAENAQLGVYQWAVEQGGAQPAPSPVVAGGGELVYLAASSNEHAKVLPQPALAEVPDPQWAAGLVDAVAQGARQGVFSALVTSACGGCPVRASCPALPEGGRVTP